MEPPGSTLIDHPGGGKAGLRRAAGRALGGSQLPTEEVAVLLLPIVRRAIRTARGPAALVSWLRRSAGRRTEERAATLAEDLARLLTAPTGAPADTLDDS